VGTQVVAAQVRRRVKLSSFWDDLAASGQMPSNKLLRCEIAPAPQDVAAELELEPGTSVVCLERVRYAATTPLAIMYNWLVTEGIADIIEEDLERSGLYELLRRRGIQPHIARQVIGARAATTEEAELLGLQTGAPLLTMRRTMQDISGRTVEFGSHLYDASHYAVEMTVVEGA